MPREYKDDKSLLLEVLAKIEVQTLKTDGCHLWQSTVNNKNYGLIRFRGKRYLVTRILAHKHLGLDLNDRRTYVLHKCDNPNCVRLDHLFLGTQSDNIKDSVEKKRHTNASITHCPKGHEYTPMNTITNLSANGNIMRGCRLCDSTRIKSWGYK